MLSILELPSIIKKINSAENIRNKIKEGSKQTLKSSINVVSLLSGIGLIGALFAKKGPAYSLLGMGVGSVIGTCASKAAQCQIDNFIKKD